nr:MAG TPA: hypothetical protein [Caudoviricetes sp.]
MKTLYLTGETPKSLEIEPFFGGFHVSFSSYLCR